MRASISRRRRWNNILIIGVVAFMLILNLPSIIKTYLITPAQESQYPSLLQPGHDIKAIYFSKWSLDKNQGQWRLEPMMAVDADELVQRWQDLAGTEVGDESYQKLLPQLSSPQTIEIWYEDLEEPQRITFYQTPNFWLLKNWQDKWIAVSVEESYLFP